ncbi:LuxR C-terminal-related transcriptional regulator [Olivibacter ginsenosidimutans]|uniref:LuxR C-terminal-related transcriptional regulator n=1 Tax=Olivibacter ginsenosidimutans TaxID=1176537 RepID=A0ABP9ADF4_9SPHI
METKEQQVDSLLKQAKRYRLSGHFKANLQTIVIAKKIAEQAQNRTQQVQIFGELSRQKLYDNDFDLAKKYADSAAKMASDSKEVYAKIWGKMALANYYNYLNIRDLAVKNAQDALALIPANKDDDLKSRLYYLLYTVYSSWNDLKLTTKYAQLSTTYAQRAKDYDLLSNSYTAQSVAIEMDYQQRKNQLLLDSMLYKLHQAANLFKLYPGAVGNNTYAIANLNIANHYFQYHELSHQYVQDSIRKYALRAQQAVADQDLNYLIHGNVNGLLAELETHNGNYKQAEIYLQDSYVHLAEAELPQYYALTQVTEGLSRLYEKIGQDQKALSFLRKKEMYNSKLFDQNQIVQSHKLEAQYENQRILLEMKNIKAQQQSRKIQNILYASVAVLALISLILLYYSYRNKIRLHTEQQLNLQKEKEDALAIAQMREKEKRFLLVEKAEAERHARMQLRLEQEEQARLKAEQELLKIQKEQMEREALADALQIERKNELLLQLKDRLETFVDEEDKGVIAKIIRTELRHEETLNKSTKEFQEIHSSFFQKLKELSDHKLTPLDLKYCAYMHLRLSTKEMASVFNVEPKSIRVSKYRIKQKLHLPKEVELDTFLQDLV